MNTDIVLSVENLTKYYPGVVALDHVSFGIKRGEVHALLGENGAGKSTLIKAVAGAIEPDEGLIHIGNDSYGKISPKESREHNIEVIFQEFNLVPTLTVAENILLGDKRGKLVDFKQMRRVAKGLLSSLGIKIDPDRLVRELTPAQQELVEISKAIAKDVKILIMDEPTAPLTMHETELLFKIIERLKKDGVTIIYISHRMEEIFKICDRVTVMRDGKYIQTLDIAKTDREELIQLMVGRKLETDYPVRDCVKDETVLEVENLSGNGVSDISFSLKKGEILGVAGLVGSGRTEIIRVLYGAEPADGGSVKINGEAVHIKRVTDAIRLGFGLIPEDRKAQGLFLNMDIKWNIVFNNIRAISKHGVVNEKKEKETADTYCKKLRIKTPSLSQKAVNLSGGNQQKVVLAKTLAQNARIVIFDEPTRGIDVGAKQEIYLLMNEMVEAGKSIIMISSDMEELLGMSDRIVVLSEGKQAGTVEKENFSQEYILNLASGE